MNAVVEYRKELASRGLWPVPEDGSLLCIADTAIAELEAENERLRGGLLLQADHRAIVAENELAALKASHTTADWNAKQDRIAALEGEVADAKAVLKDVLCRTAHELTALEAEVAELQRTNQQLIAASADHDILGVEAEKTAVRWQNCVEDNNRLTTALEQAEAEVASLQTEHNAIAAKYKQKWQQAEAEVASLKARRCGTCKLNGYCYRMLAYDIDYPDETVELDFCSKWAERGTK